MLNNFPDFLSGHTDTLIVLRSFPTSALKPFRPKGQDGSPIQEANRKIRMTDDAFYLAELLHKNHKFQRKRSNDERQQHAWNLCGALLSLLSVFFQVTLKELRSAERGNNHVARIRQFGMYIAHTMFGLSMSEVAYAFCRERTTVKHACHLIEDMRENEKFDSNVSDFEYLVRSLYPGIGSVAE